MFIIICQEMLQTLDQVDPSTSELTWLFRLCTGFVAIVKDIIVPPPFLVLNASTPHAPAEGTGDLCTCQHHATMRAMDAQCYIVQFSCSIVQFNPNVVDCWIFIEMA
jgi:hypothetical protein